MFRCSLIQRTGVQPSLQNGSVNGFNGGVRWRRSGARCGFSNTNVIFIRLSVVRIRYYYYITDIIYSKYSSGVLSVFTLMNYFFSQGLQINAEASCLYAPKSSSLRGTIWDLGDLHRRMGSYRKLRSIHSTYGTLAHPQHVVEKRAL